MRFIGKQQFRSQENPIVSHSQVHKNLVINLDTFKLGAKLISKREKVVTFSISDVLYAFYSENRGAKSFWACSDVKYSIKSFLKSTSGFSATKRREVVFAFPSALPKTCPTEVPADETCVAKSNPNIWTVVISSTISNLLAVYANHTVHVLCKALRTLNVPWVESLLPPVDVPVALSVKGTAPEESGKADVDDPSSRVFVVLGWSGDKPATSIEVFDSSAHKWCFYQEEVPFLRAYHGVAALSGRVYLVGGFDGYTCLETCVCLDLQSRQWLASASMSAPRCYVSVLALKGRIYAFGGHNGENRLRTCEKFDPRLNSWTPISHMRYRRSDAAAAELNGKILVCGGFDGFSFQATTEIYDINTNQWTMTARMFCPRSGHSTIGLDGYVYLLGGFDGEQRIRNVEKYDEESNEWESVGPMLNRRSNFCAVIFKGEIYAIGGFNGVTTIADAEKLDRSTMEWKSVPSLNIHRSAAGACVVKDSGNISACASKDIVPVNSTDIEEPSP